MWMVHPPVPQSPDWREDGRVGTKKWWGLKPVIKGMAGVFRAKGGLPEERYGDGVGFPIVTPFSFGVWIPLATIECEAGKEIIAGGRR